MLVIMHVCAHMCVYLHARLYVCVGGARASHLCGMRCYIPNGMPQREMEGEQGRGRGRFKKMERMESYIF